MGPSKIKVAKRRREGTRAICKTLKTQVKLNLNFTRNYAITC